MQAIRKVLKIEAGKVMVDIPEYFGEKVEVIVLPFDKEEKSDTYYLLKMQEQTGYMQALYNDPDEDVWNDL